MTAFFQHPQEKTLIHQIVFGCQNIAHTRGVDGGRRVAWFARGLSAEHAQALQRLGRDGGGDGVHQLALLDGFPEACADAQCVQRFSAVHFRRGREDQDSGPDSSRPRPDALRQFKAPASRDLRIEDRLG